MIQSRDGRLYGNPQSGNLSGFGAIPFAPLERTGARITGFSASPAGTILAAATLFSPLSWLMAFNESGDPEQPGIIQQGVSEVGGALKAGAAGFGSGLGKTLGIAAIIGIGYLIFLHESRK